MASDMAAIAAFGDIFSGVFGSIINMEANEQLAYDEYTRNRKLIQEQNEYNSPASQMQRYIEAGLNPNLIYGNGQSSAGNQSQVAQYHRPDFNLGANIGEAMKFAFQIALAQKELELKDAQIANTREQEFNIRSNRMGIDMDNAFKSTLMNYNPGVLLSPQELNDIRGSLQFGRYNSEAKALEITNALKTAQTELTKYSAEHQKNIAREFDKFTPQLMAAQLAGANMENELLEVERDLQKRLDSIGGKSGAKLIIDVLREVLGLIPSTHISKRR